MVRLKSEKMTAEQELKKLLGQLLYLDNLHKVMEFCLNFHVWWCSGG